MWKAFEKRVGRSIGNIFEVSFGGSSNFDAAMSGWKNSPAHKPVVGGGQTWNKFTKKGGCFAQGSFVNCIFNWGGL